MFGIDSSELLLVAIVALVVIGPKDLPKAMRIVGYWVGRARGVARQFRSGFDEMVREAELAEMEKRWAAENARIMAEHPQTDPVPADPAYPSPPVHDAPPVAEGTGSDALPTHDAFPTHDAGLAHDPATPPHGHDPATHTPEDETRPVMVEKPHVVPATDRPAPRQDAARDSASS